MTRLFSYTTSVGATRTDGSTNPSLSLRQFNLDPNQLIPMVPALKSSLDDEPTIQLSTTALNLSVVCSGSADVVIDLLLR